MPGKRLTFQERQRVAAGLAAGRTYAGIARELGRPASTILREVARNGGERGYRANRAQQATAWRARRREPDRPLAVAFEGDPGARREFEEGFVDTMARTGTPTMVAKVLVCLLTSGTGSLTAAELVARLHVSPASVSKAIGWLEQRGLVGRERDGRRDRYFVDEHVGYRAWLVSVASMARWADVSQRGADLFGTQTAAGARLRATSQFFLHLGSEMNRAAERWRQSLPVDPDAPDVWAADRHLRS